MNMMIIKGYMLVIYNENMTFYQAFGDNYINIVILDDVDIHIDAKIIQMAEKD